MAVVSNTMFTIWHWLLAVFVAPMLLTPSIKVPSNPSIWGQAYKQLHVDAVYTYCTQPAFKHSHHMQMMKDMFYCVDDALAHTRLFEDDMHHFNFTHAMHAIDFNALFNVTLAVQLLSIPRVDILVSQEALEAYHNIVVSYDATVVDFIRTFNPKEKNFTHLCRLGKMADESVEACERMIEFVSENEHDAILTECKPAHEWLLPDDTELDACHMMCPNNFKLTTVDAPVPHTCNTRYMSLAAYWLAKTSFDTFANQGVYQECKTVIPQKEDTTFVGKCERIAY